MADLQAGSVFAGHRIEAVAGRGGMGVVYQAVHLDLGRTVALKVIAAELAGDSSFRERFRRESRIAASLDHPNVIPLFEAGEEDGALYISMRYVKGTDLGQLILSEGRLDSLRASRIIDQVADALDAAHEVGLVHRDVKPANVLIERRPRGDHAHLTDFGLTKLASSESGMTGTGMFVGTIDYIAPEQLEGKRLDARSDVYALGCVLFHSLTGSVPYPRDTQVATMFAHASTPPPSARELVPTLPAEVDQVIERAMAKRPDDRYLSAGDLARAALSAAEGRSVTRAERSVAAGPAAPTGVAAVPPASPRTEPPPTAPPEPPDSNRAEETTAGQPEETAAAQQGEPRRPPFRPPPEVHANEPRHGPVAPLKEGDWTEPGTVPAEETPTRRTPPHVAATDDAGTPERPPAPSEGVLLPGVGRPLRTPVLLFGAGALGVLLLGVVLATAGVFSGEPSAVDSADGGADGSASHDVSPVGGAAALNLVIGDSVPLSGDLADFGPPGQKAAELAIQEIQSAIDEVGVDHTVEIVHEDNGGGADQQAAVQAARKLVDSDGASCLAGAWASTDTIPTAESVAIPEQIPLISPASTSDEITGLEDDGVVSRTALPDSRQGPALAELLDEELAGGADGKTVNIGARNDAYGTGLVETFSAAFEEIGGTVGEKVVYDTNLPSYDTEAQQITSGNPDATVIFDFSETYSKVGPALARAGFDPETTFVTDGLILGDLVKSAGEEAVVGLRGITPGAPDQGAASDAFDKAYRMAEPKNIDRTQFDAQNFDAVMLCYLGAVAAGSTDGAAIAEQIQGITAAGGTKYSFEQLPQAIEALQNGEDIDYEGASGPIEQDEAGDATAGVYDVYEFGPDGVPEPVDQVPVAKQ